MIYAIGDIHGHLSKLIDAHRLIADDKARMGAQDAPIVHVGDLVDRGPDSAGVIDYLMRGTAKGEPWISLLGNHDRLMLWFLEDHTRADPRLRADFNWLHQNMGGRETLRSYGVDTGSDISEMQRSARELIPPDHVTFLRSLKLYFRLNSLYFCHAGIRPGVPLDQQDEDDLVWIRKDFHLDQTDYGALIIHGHTPIDEVTHYGNRVNIDTGAAWGHDLSAVAIDGEDVFLLTENGRVPVEKSV